MNPGVGDYNVANTHLNILNKSSNPTIGNQKRF